MSETDLTDNAVPTLDLDAWLDGATVQQASVDILQRPDLLARWQDWERRYDRAEATSKTAAAELSFGEESPLAELEREGEDLLEEISASRATWYMAALDSDDIQAIVDAFPEPAKPQPFTRALPSLQKSPTDAQARAYLKAFQAWEHDRDQYNADHRDEQDAWARAAQAMMIDRGAEKIVRSLDRIEVRGQVIATSITHEQALGLTKRIGEAQVAAILTAVDAATSEEPVVPADFSRRASETDPT